MEWNVNTDYQRLTWDTNKNVLKQKWRVVYVDTLKADYKKGQYNPRYGLHVGVDFYV
jgi:hypothetical protein